MRTPFVLIPQYFGGIVFRRSDARYLPFDGETTDLLRKLVGFRIDQVLADLAPNDPKREELCRFFEVFEKQGWFTPAGRFAAEILDLDPPPDHLAGPLAVHLEVTADCNLRCSHCFTGDLSARTLDGAPLTLPELQRLFAELASCGSFRLGLTGGEPLLRKDLLEIIDSAIDAGLHPCLTTNGLLLTEELARQLGQRKPLLLSVSLEGATEETNDAVRGPGTFRQVLAAMEHLRQARVPFGLSFTLSRSNADEVSRCTALAHHVGAAAAVFRPLYPVGKAAGNLAQMPSYRQYAETLAEIGRCVQLDGEMHVIDPFSPALRDERRAEILPGAGCGAAHLVASISADGYVNPCSFLGESFNAGNIRRETFLSIWHNSQVFRRLRKVESKEGFRGGCRARALAFHGSIDSVDPWHEEYLKIRAAQPAFA